MTHIICSDIVASISELKANPMATVQSASGKPIAILNRNQPVFYCVPADLYEVMMETFDDIELTKIIKERANEKEILVILMIYKLTFLESAQKEWNKLTPDIQKQFKTKLIQRLISPHVPKDRLSGLQNCYKIKLKTIGYRLVYKVIESRLVLQTIAVGHRDKNTVYKLAHKRLES